MPHPQARPSRPVFVVMGVSGSGKSTVGAAFARRLGIDFVDGDDLHPAANVAKMHGGHPLTDDDRWPWLDRVAAVLADRDAHPAGVVVACSALRRRYRDRIRRGADRGADQVAGETRPVFLFLDITPALAESRLQSRKGHFMPASLVGSQFDTLERPGPDEADVLRVEEHNGVEANAEAAFEAVSAHAGLPGFSEP